MVQLWHIATNGPNILPSIFLVLIILYWISVIIGVLDIDIFDFSVEPDVSAGPLQATLLFLHLNDIPIMVFLSFWVLFTWVGTVSVSYLFGDNLSTVPSLAIIAINTIVMLLVTTIATAPLKKVFQKGNDNPPLQMAGQLCILRTDCQPGRLGQGEVKTGGAPLVVNVMTRPDSSMEKGQTALIIQKDEKKDLYIIEPFNDWEE